MDAQPPPYPPYPPFPPYPPYPPIIIYPPHCCCCHGHGHAYHASGGQFAPGAPGGGATPPTGGAAPPAGGGAAPPAAGGTKPGLKIPNPLEVLLGVPAGLVGGIAGAAEDAAGLVGGVAGGVSDFLDSIF